MTPGCTGKAAYVNAREARTALKRASNSHNGRPYQCHHCGFVHVTTWTRQAHKQRTGRRW